MTCYSLHFWYRIKRDLYSVRCCTVAYTSVTFLRCLNITVMFFWSYSFSPGSVSKYKSRVIYLLFCLCSKYDFIIKSLTVTLKIMKISSSYIFVKIKRAAVAERDWNILFSERCQIPYWFVFMTPLWPVSFRLRPPRKDLIFILHCRIKNGFFGGLSGGTHP